MMESTGLPASFLLQAGTRIHRYRDHLLNRSLDDAEV